MSRLRVKAKITRTVTETVTCIVDHDGNIEEIEDIHEEHEYDILDHNVLYVINSIG